MGRLKTAVYLIAKAPRAGAAKTRLCPPLHAEQAARLAEAFLLDAATVIERAGCQVRVMCRNQAERRALERTLGSIAIVSVQTGRGLGAALESAFRQGLAAGFDAVGVLGADSPTVPPAVVREAFAALGHGADVALGPSDDGGYYFLAARALHLSLFQDVPWSTEVVGALTLTRCREAGLSTHLLPTWYDIDNASSLARLVDDLHHGASWLAPCTRAALSLDPPRLSVPRLPDQRAPWGAIA